MTKLKVGIIGCGTIGSEIAKACRERLSDRIELTGICDIDEKKAASLNKALKPKVPVLKLDDLIKKSGIIVEAASAKVSAQVLEKCVKAGKGCLVMSVGGLLGREDLLKKAEAKAVKVYIPSGALSGIDGLKSAAAGRIDSVTLTTRKPPKGLEGAPFIIQKGIVLSDIKEETVIFEGSAAEAVKGFPQNVNVSAVLSLAGIGARKTQVKIVSSPSYTANIHEVEIKGEFGRITTKAENLPSGTNPKTSALAIFSAVATLEGIAKSVHIGT